MDWQKIKDYLNKWLKRALDIEDKYTRNNIDMTGDLIKQFPGAYIFITDAKPRLIRQQDMHRLKIFNVSRFRKWKKEIHDCDNFAFEFKGIMSYLHGRHAFGIVFVDTGYGTKHALNCFIDEFNKFNYFEPQTNNIFREKEGYEPYLIVI